MNLRWSQLLWLLLMVVVLSPPSEAANCSTFTPQELDDHFQQSASSEQTRIDLELELAKEGKVIKSTQKVADLCLLRQKNHDPLTRMRELKQLPFDTVTTKLIEKYKLSPAEITACLPAVPLQCDSCVRARNACAAVRQGGGPCDPGARFRTADGTCNNLNNPGWGAADACFMRLLPARYEGEFGFRQSVLGGPLPEPRDLSMRVHMDKITDDVTNIDVTNMYVFFGQLLDHDISQAPFSVTVDNQPVQCCGVAGPLHPQCAPILVRRSDPLYTYFGTTCINFVRSAVCPTCTLGPRQQINQRTAFIDCSFVYGNSVNETNNLRTNDGTGRLRVSKSQGGDVLISSPDPVNDQCSYVNTSSICFLAGDSRVNQHTTLASLHTIFMREHNRLADGLRRFHPTWTDERLFQEARRILGAEMQVITYKEYLPITLGRERTRKFDLELRYRAARTAYDPRTNPTLFNEFSGAAFRFGHSLIGSVVRGYYYQKSTYVEDLLRNEFFHPFNLRRGLIDLLMDGVPKTPAQFFDLRLVPDVTQYLYRRSNHPAGLDLAAINIQRGRDHGLPSYADVVRFCSGVAINTFRDLVLKLNTSEDNANLLAQNYRSVYDVDLWTGILSETQGEDAVVGPTGGCIIAGQFHNLKFGDRFYFEHADQAGSFTSQQVQQLKDMSLSKLICLNTNVKQIQSNAMLFQSESNLLITCGTFNGVDLRIF